MEIGTILSHRTKQGLVEIRMGSERVQMEIGKAKEVCGMLLAAIEAATTDEIFFKFMTESVGMDEAQASRALLDLRELRQGTRDTRSPVN